MLSSNTTYYVRAYTSNSLGTGYGTETSFTTIGPLPTLTTNYISHYTETTATAGGVITDTGSSSVIASGVCWSTNHNPTLADASTSDSATFGWFSSEMSGLITGTTYYVRSYATNSQGTGYGKEKSVTTWGQLPIVYTDNSVLVQLPNCTVQTTVVNNIAGAAVTERGVCWSTSPHPTAANYVIPSGTGAGNFTTVIRTLSTGPTYYVRAYAVNSFGTAYSNENIIKTDSNVVVPTISTNAVTGVTDSTAASGGLISSEGGSYISSKGICWSIAVNPTLNDFISTNAGIGASSFSSQMTGLTANKVYYVRAFATNDYGYSFGNNVKFRTHYAAGVLTTTDVSGINYNGAVTGGTITTAAGLDITARGVCWSTSAHPTISDFKTVNAGSIGTYTSSLYPLSPNTTYYVRAYATNPDITNYGNEISFTTPQRDSTFTDPRDGQQYTFKQIGTQVWMTQNLNYVTSAGSICYNNNGSNCDVYGRLYRWDSALTVAPPGWHLPSNDEWLTLINYLGGTYVAGGKMKTTVLWTSPNSNATNSSGFAGLPAGGYYPTGSQFNNLGKSGLFWSSTISTPATLAKSTWLSFDSQSATNGGSLKSSYYSVRCIRD